MVRRTARLGSSLVSCAVRVLLGAVLVQTRIQGPANKEQPYASIVYTAVARGKVALPCDISPPTPDDSVTLVLWYKDESLAPIFTLDSRRAHVDQARQSLSGPGLEQRAHFNMANQPAFLQIDPVEEADAGEYRCRVDFRRGRSINTVIHLNVIVPPGDPIIVDEDGRRMEGLVGRFNEGENLRLVCQVQGGKPRPVVTWWRDKRLVDDNYTVVGDAVHNSFEIRELSRSDFLVVLTCQASNNNVTVAASRSITLDMNLIPLDVTIQPPKRPLSADKEIELVCSSSGSRPPAMLTWWKSGEQILSSKEHQVQEGVSTSSSLILFTPRAEDNGLVLSCRAENQFIPGSAIEEGWKLDVFYKPRITLMLGQNLKEHDIHEGRDVYLECHVEASPPASEVTWLFEGHEVATNTSAGVIVSNQSLVLQKVRRSRRGRYSCTAANREGHGTSNIFILRIKFAPVCKPGQKRIYGVSQLDSVSVHCELEADPGDVTFHWRFNSSSSGKRIDLASYSHAQTRSTAIYSPQNSDDFGYLLCWGANEVGKQLHPCNFTIVPAGPPEPVSNCSQLNATEDSVSFECAEGSWDGGVTPVTFFAELHDVDSGRLVANASSSPVAAFGFSGLAGGTSFRASMYARNAKGHRPPTRFVVSTLRPAEKLTAGSQAIIIIRPVLGVIMGIILTLVIAAIVIILFIRYKHPRKTRDEYKERTDDKSQSLLKKDGEEFADIEGRGPDIIPAAPLTYNQEQEDKKEYEKHTVTSYYNLPVTTNEISHSGTLPSNKYANGKHTSSQEGSDLTYVELALSRSGGSCMSATLPRPHRTGLEDFRGAEYGRIDFQGSTALRPLPSGHQIPGGPEDMNEDGTIRPNLSDLPLVTGNRMESTV
ncbi:neural cell adhesion molecule 2-like [Dermacentor andersoni]|uniref:neural cell adhesion molecule 2-like n=1 Tax=Dermacentor andersoni TaxID=34620 RepID=UPI002155710F|nr:hemicentin-2-like [Dermacentor andersoni]